MSGEMHIPPKQSPLLIVRHAPFSGYGSFRDPFFSRDRGGELCFGVKGLLLRFRAVLVFLGIAYAGATGEFPR